MDKRAFIGPTLSMGIALAFGNQAIAQKTLNTETKLVVVDQSELACHLLEASGEKRLQARLRWEMGLPCGDLPDPDQVEASKSRVVVGYVDLALGARRAADAAPAAQAAGRRAGPSGGRRCGLFREEYVGTTLRSHFGLEPVKG